MQLLYEIIKRGDKYLVVNKKSRCAVAFAYAVGDNGPPGRLLSMVQTLNNKSIANPDCPDCLHGTHKCTACLAFILHDEKLCPDCIETARWLDQTS